MFQIQDDSVLRIPAHIHLAPGECGPACLSALLTAYGVKTTPEEIAAQVGNGRGGVSLLDLVKVSRSFGFEAYGLEVSARNLRSVGVPVIAHCYPGHFIVVEKVRRLVTIVDPTRGRSAIDIETFARRFSGKVAVVVPQEKRPLGWAHGRAWGG